MRCLFCGKELAFLKRLTGGAEFCSDAHRKKYQEQFNDLALNRLLESQPKSVPQPAEPIPEPQIPPPIPMVADDSPNMAGFVAELPTPYAPGALKIEGGEPPLLGPLHLAMPTHDFPSGELAREYSLPWALPVVWQWTTAFRPTLVHPHKNRVEPREFSFETMRPSLQLAAEARDAQSEWSPAPAWETLPQAKNQFRPPSDPPELWHAAPRSFALAMENQSRLEFDIIRLAPASNPPASLAGLEPPNPYTEPLPVVLRGVSPGIARSVAVTSAAPAPIDFPDSWDALPLGPAIVLKSKPVELSSAAAVPAILGKEVSGKPRPEVRIVPIKATPTTPVPPVSSKPTPERPEPIKLPKPPLISPSPASQLGLPELHAIEDKGIWTRMPMAAKLTLAAVIVLSIGGFAYMTLTSAHAAAKTSTPRMEPRWEPGNQINTNGWIEDWAPADAFRRVTLMRGTENLSNYRLAFTAQIQKKAVGWMFRGLNPKNYYVAKLEKLNPGPEPTVAFARYAVIDGKNEGRVEKILPMKVHVGTSYKIRFDATGSHFAVWVMGEKVDEWEDPRLGSGGLGLYSEGDEAPAIQGSVSAWELVSSVAGKQ